MFVRPAPPLLFLTCLSACLSRDGGLATTVIDLSTGSGSSSSDTGSSTGPGLMTTTFDEDSSTGLTGSASSASSSSSTGEAPPTCGDGVVDAGEDCDAGPANADDAACTSACQSARCGDGHVLKDMEECDLGPDNHNGTYNGCNQDCTLGPRCGDGIVQAQAGEACDDQDPKTAPKAGCLKGCAIAETCRQLQSDWGADAPTGIYPLRPHPDQPMLEAYCDMSADGGGYTFVKYAVQDGLDVTAKQAELECGKLGLRLFIPRTPAHLAATFALPPALAPIGGGEPTTIDHYLAILAIYPKTPGQSCPGAALNRDACPAWEAGDGGDFFVSSTQVSPTEPGLKNCSGCSMAYYWDLMSDPPKIDFFEAIDNFKKGATSPHFLCAAGDK